ncbi:MAG: class I SAM-dependent methyltransferase [Pseudomonadota bacterium]
MSSMEFFARALKNTDSRLLTKWAHYFTIYDREFSQWRDAPISFLEIGVFKGGSIPMWKAFFRKAERLTFIDIDPACEAHAEEGTTVEIGDQSDPDFLKRLIDKHGPFDLILDDGSHVCRHQIASFEGLWPAIKDRGLYVVEDCHTSYWPGFGGGYRNEASFIEFAKRKVDAMHSWYTDQDDLFALDPIARELASVRFYDSIVVFEKQKKPEPPKTITSVDGDVKTSRRPLEIRGRVSLFAGKDGT